jgi:kynurenine formamidase
MLGVQPGETFNYGTLTTKPYTTCATYYNPTATGTWPARYLSDLPADHLVGVATVVPLLDVGPGDEITLAKLKSAAPPVAPGAIVLLRTDYSKHRPEIPSDDYYLRSPVLARDAAAWLAQQRIKILGTDARCLDPRYARLDPSGNVHGLLNSAGIVVVEDLVNLDQVTDDRNFVIVGIPLPIRGVIGGPARVFAVNLAEPTDFADLTHPLDAYPQPKPDHPYPFMPAPSKPRPLNRLGDYPNPLPGRIEPREEQERVARMTRLIPFRLVDPQGRPLGEEMYIQYGHSTTTHIEGAYFDPWGRHLVPDAILRRYVRMPADRLIGRACLIDLTDWIGPRQQIDATHLELNDPGVQSGDIVFVRTNITEWWYYGSNIGVTPGFSPDAAMWLVEKGIRTLVLDCPSVERSDPLGDDPAVRYTSNKVHYFLHKNDIPIVDWGTNFRGFRKSRFIAAIMALPASHQGGFPAHVFALEEW